MSIYYNDNMVNNNNAYFVDGDVETTDTELNYNTDFDNSDTKSDIGTLSEAGTGIETLFEGMKFLCFRPYN